MKSLFVAFSCFIGLLSSSAFAGGVDVCSSYKSTGNPFECCTNCNCTWWAWKKARDNNWADIPIKQANLWDDVAREKTKLYNLSEIPSVGAIAVRESSPYPCIINGKKQTCDSGHVAYVEELSKDKNGKPTVIISQMSCDSGKGGVTKQTLPVSSFDTYITNISYEGKDMKDSCTDGKVVNSFTDKSGNKVNLYWSNSCKTNWSEVIAKDKKATLTATVTNTVSGRKLLHKGVGSAVSPMIHGAYQTTCAGGMISGKPIQETCK